MAKLNLNGDQLIRFPVEDSKANYLAGFWRWVELLAADDYQGALEALHWPKGTGWTPAKLKERVTTFFGGDAPWSACSTSASRTAFGAVRSCQAYYIPLSQHQSSQPTHVASSGVPASVSVTV